MEFNGFEWTPKSQALNSNSEGPNSYIGQLGKKMKMILPGSVKLVDFICILGVTWDEDFGYQYPSPTALASRNKFVVFLLYIVSET